MATNKLLNISLSTIQCFNEIVKYGNMLAAAASLNVTQPLLSHRISTLENEIGVSLFERRKGRLILTPAGTHIYNRWSAVINNVERSIAEAQEIQASQKKSICIGLCTCNWGYQFVQNIFDYLQSQFEDHNISIKLLQIEDVPGMLHTIFAGIDLILFPDYCNASNSFANQAEICFEQAGMFPMCINISNRNALSKKKTVHWTDLKNREWAMLSETFGTPYEKAMIEFCARYGFQPNFIQCDSLPDIWLKIALDNAVGVSPIYNTFGMSDCASTIIEDSLVSYMLVYKKGETPKVLPFVRAMCAFLEEYSAILDFK